MTMHRTTETIGQRPAHDRAIRRRPRRLAAPLRSAPWR